MRPTLVVCTVLRTCPVWRRNWPIFRYCCALRGSIIWDCCFINTFKILNQSYPWRKYLILRNYKIRTAPYLENVSFRQLSHNWELSNIWGLSYSGNHVKERNCSLSWALPYRKSVLYIQEELSQILKNVPYWGLYGGHNRRTVVFCGCSPSAYSRHFSMTLTVL